MNRSPEHRHEDRAPRILVVDDMPDNLFLMNGLLEDLYEVVPATSGQEALKVVMSDNPPDMVLLDIMMPDMDGYEVLRRIRQHPPTANIPIIFLTALASQRDERLGRDLGAIDYLTKPVDPEQVVKRLEAHVLATREARWMDELSERMSRHLSPQEWERLVKGPDRASIRFEERTLTVLYAETATLPGFGERVRDSFTAEVDWLVTRFRGRADRFVFGAVVAYFDDAQACVRMSTALQRTAKELRLSIGVHTGFGVVASFQSGGRTFTTLLGAETGRAARLASTAATGSVLVSPETYALVQGSLPEISEGCLLTEEFHDSDLAHASLTPAPSMMSTFAGLGLT